MRRRDARLILLVDDHTAVRQRLALNLEEEGIGDCREAAGLHEALDITAREAPDVALVDLSPGTEQALRLVTELHERHIPVLVCSMHEESSYIRRALAAGARGTSQRTQSATGACARLSRDPGGLDADHHSCSGGSAAELSHVTQESATKLLYRRGVTVTSILIVDDHAVVRKGLKHALCEKIRDAVFGETGSFQGALDAVAKRRWDIVILDISLPEGGGFALLEEMRRHCPDIKVLMLDLHADRQYAIRSRELGARGYISKDASLVALHNAVRAVIDGKGYFPVSDHIASASNGAGQNFHHQLSGRERNVLLGVSAGEGIGEIAEKLGLSVKTVSTYKARVLNKLQLNSTADLVRYVLTESRTI